VPIIPFRYDQPFARRTGLLTLDTVLDAPGLRDDFYCSVLAYSSVAKVLAVGLGDMVYLWNEKGGTESPPSLNPPQSGYVTSLSFSSKKAGKAILAVGRSTGQFVLYSPLDSEARFDSRQPSPVCCVAFRPTTVKRPSQRDKYLEVDTEELLVRDEAGHVYVYAVEWPTPVDRDLFGFPGSLTLLARLTVHSQQICGLAWANDGELFATGGNDNHCHLFETSRIHREAASYRNGDSNPSSEVQISGQNRRNVTLESPSFSISALFARHRFTLSAAVKAIAFCP
jgi:WD40 repeat protein